MDNRFKVEDVLWILPAILLLIAVFLKFPYGFYELLRVVVSVCAVYYAIKAFRNDAPVWGVFFIMIIALFNPIFPVKLGSKPLWIPVDIAAAIVFILGQKKITKSNT